MNTGLRTWFDKAGPTGQTLTILAAVAALLFLGFAMRWIAKALRGKKAADVLTVIAAAMASSVAATGMWHFFSRTMHLPVWIQAVLFAFMEISVLASALRARANVARDGEAGADGLAVWVLTCASGLMSASEAASPQEALVRLGAPLVAAWLWERSMVPERRAQKAAKGTAEAAVRWIFSVKRVAVRLGLATALGADLETEDANRRIDRFVRADNRAQRAGVLTRRRSGRRRDRAHARLMEQARMQADPRALYSHLGRQAILDVLARLGGDDAVIDRERARQMQHILADATGGTAGPAQTQQTQEHGQANAGMGTGAVTANVADAPTTAAAAPPASVPAAANPATAPAAPAPAAPATQQPVPQPVAAGYAPSPHDAMMLQLLDQAVPLTDEAQPEQTQQLTPLQDELPLQLPEQPVLVVEATSGSPTGFRIPAARHGNHRAAAANGNQQPVNGTGPGSAIHAPIQTPVPANATGTSRAARAHVPADQDRFVAAPLPEPEPEPEPAPATPATPAYAAPAPAPVQAPRPAPQPEPVYEPELPEPAPQQPQPEQSTLPRPPAAVSQPLIDQQLAARITKAMAASRIPPNPLKLANELGISPALMHDTIEALGGFNALWSRMRQDQDAESPETLEFYTA